MAKLYAFMGSFTSLNKYILKERTNRFAGAKLKKGETDRVVHGLWSVKPLEGRYDVSFTWFCKDKRQDPDNIAFAKKFILDGFVKAGVLKNDGWKQIRSFKDTFMVDKNERVEVSFTKCD